MNPELPEQVRRQIATADAAVAAMMGDPAPAAPPGEPAAIQPTPGEPAAIQPTPGEPAAPVTPPSNEPPEPANWEHRYNSMKGRFDVLSADMTRATSEIAELRARLTAAASERPASAAIPVPADFELTPQERADYGDDFVAVIEKRARAAVHGELSEIREQYRQLAGQVANVAVSTTVDARTRMLSNLDSMPFDWRAVNASEPWKAWLAAPDPLSGVVRQDMLISAWEGNDAARVQRFFEGYLAETAAAAPSAPQHVSGAPSGAPAITLASLAAPGSAGTGAATSLPPEKPVFTPAQVGRFYTDKAMGKYRGREAEAAALLAAIELATAEGRVRA